MNIFTILESEPFFKQSINDGIQMFKNGMFKNSNFKQELLKEIEKCNKQVFFYFDNLKQSTIRNFLKGSNQMKYPCRIV